MFLPAFGWPLNVGGVRSGGRGTGLLGVLTAGADCVSHEQLLQAGAIADP
jgi:hypothetical protein